MTICSAILHLIVDIWSFILSSVYAGINALSSSWKLTSELLQGGQGFLSKQAGALSATKPPI